MTWTRDNRALRAGYPLSAGPLVDIVRGNAAHFIEQCKIDITTPINGGTLGGGVLLSESTGNPSWLGAFATIRPFPVPVNRNTNGTYRTLTFTIKGYFQGGSSSKMQVYLARYPLYGVFTNGNFPQYWNPTGYDTTGIMCDGFDVYGTTAISATAGEKTIEVAVTPVDDVVNRESLPEVTIAKSTGYFSQIESTPHVWVMIDAYIAASSSFRFRTLRVQG